MSTQSEIRLLGQRIVLKSSQVDPELVQPVVDLVNSKIKDAEKRSKGSVPHLVALLALLDLAEEYIRAKRRTADFKKQVDDRSERLISLIESELGS